MADRETIGSGASAGEHPRFRVHSGSPVGLVFSILRESEDASSGTGEDRVEAALARALHRASDAGRFDVVAQLAREFEARRLARSAT
jgi:hypothetical protein